MPEKFVNGRPDPFRTPPPHIERSTRATTFKKSHDVWGALKVTLRGPDASRKPGVHQLVGEIPAAYKMKDVSPTFEAHCPGVSLMLESGQYLGPFMILGVRLRVVYCSCHEIFPTPIRFTTKPPPPPGVVIA